MPTLLQLANYRPDGPSWSPYAAVGGVVIIFIILGIGYLRKRK
ncbi:hypothetical protein [Streptomyces sp. CO7]